MKNNLVGISVAVVCAVIVIGTILVPTINDATQTHGTFTNTGVFNMKEFEDGDVFSRDPINLVWMYNGETATDVVAGNYSAVMTESALIRATGYLYSVNKTGQYGYSTATVDGTDLEVDVSNAGTTVTTFDYSSGWGVTSDSDYILLDYGTSAYIKGDSQIYGTGITFVYSESMSFVLCHLEGTIDDGITVSVSIPQNSTVTSPSVSNVVVNATAVDGYDDLYLFESVTFDLTGTTSDSVERTVAATYSSVIVPESVTSELTYHMEELEITLFSIVPLFLILGVLCAVTYAVMRNRD